MNVTDRDEVRAIFDNPTFEVPTAPPARDGIAWLRASVSRFANGKVHARRRALADQELERLRPLDLRAMAERLAEAYDARDVPLAVLCTCFGVAGSALPQAVADARAIACSYPLDSSPVEGVDAAVSRLVALLGTADEATAARLALLAQAGAATGALIAGAIEQLRADPGRRPIEDVLADTLRRRPPVTSTRRQRGGRIVVLDLASAELPFGHGHRACPGREHALALAAGVLDHEQRRE